MRKKVLLILGMLILLLFAMSTTVFAENCPRCGSSKYGFHELNCPKCSNFYYGPWYCPKCGYSVYRRDLGTDVKIKKAATCTETGISVSYTTHIHTSGKATQCPKDNGTETTISALGHSYGSWSNKDGSTHTRTCSRCGSVETANHSGGTATCTSPATCSVCNTAYGNALGHNWEKKYNTNVTCTTGGSWTEVCSRCGATGSSGTTPALGHDYSYRGNNHLRSSATCTSAATYYYECSRCSAYTTGSYYASGSALGHAYPSSYSSTSSIHYKDCTRCSTRLTSGSHYDNNNDARCDACGYVMIIYVAKPTATTTTFTYNGNTHSIVLSGFNSSTMNITGNSATNAGNYTAIVSLKDTTKYKWTDGSSSSISFAWTINKATISDSNAPKGNSLTYNGYSQTGLVNTSNCIITGTSSALHVGNYIAQAVPDSNHKWADGTSAQRTITWSISQKTVSIVWRQTTFYYDETKKVPTATATGVGTDIITISATGSQTNPGTYTATAVCAVSGNGYASDYKFTNTSTSYIIKNGIIEGSVAITGTNMIGETLTARLSVTKPINGTTASYQWYSNTSNSTTGGTAISGATSATYTISKGLADKYIYVVATVSKQYYDTKAFTDITDSSNGTAIVSRKSITVPTINGTYIYTGTEQTIRLNNFDSTTMNVSNNTRIDAGTQTVTVSLKDPANYKWPDNTTASKNISWTIETKKVNAVWGSKTTFTYNGKEQAPDVTADSGIPGETLNLTRTTQVNAGTYTSVATISSVTGGRGKVSNYTLLNNTITYMINKAECKIVLTKAHLDLLKNQTKTVGYTYNGDGTLSVSVVNTAIANATINTPNKLVSATGVTEGDTTVTVIGSEGTNYLTTSASFTVSVHPSPTIESVKINNGAKTTKNVEVVMEIKATSVSEMYISNTNETPDINAAGWVDYKLYSKHKLTWQNGAKTVYVWGKDEFDNMTVASTAGITLDARYLLSLKNNQKYLGRLESSSKYAIKADDGGWQWQDSNVFTNLVPITVYTFKTQLYDIVGITGESDELKLRAIYDNDGKLYIEYIN